MVASLEVQPQKVHSRSFFGENITGDNVLLWNWYMYLLGVHKFEATPTKQNLGISLRIFSKFLMSTTILSIWDSPPPGSLFSLCAVDNSAYFVMCQVWLHEHRGSLSPFKHALILAKVFHFYLISCMKMLIILLANIDAENIKKLKKKYYRNI